MTSRRAWAESLVRKWMDSDSSGDEPAGDRRRTPSKTYKRDEETEFPHQKKSRRSDLSPMRLPKSVPRRKSLLKNDSPKEKSSEKVVNNNSRKVSLNVQDVGDDSGISGFSVQRKQSPHRWGFVPTNQRSLASSHIREGERFRSRSNSVAQRRHSHSRQDTDDEWTSYSDDSGSNTESSSDDGIRRSASHVVNSFETEIAKLREKILTTNLGGSQGSSKTRNMREARIRDIIAAQTDLSTRPAKTHPAHTGMNVSRGQNHVTTTTRASTSSPQRQRRPQQWKNSRLSRASAQREADLFNELERMTGSASQLSDSQDHNDKRNSHYVDARDTESVLIQENQILHDRLAKLEQHLMEIESRHETEVHEVEAVVNQIFQLRSKMFESPSAPVPSRPNSSPRDVSPSPKRVLRSPRQVYQTASLSPSLTRSVSFTVENDQDESYQRQAVIVQQQVPYLQEQGEHAQGVSDSPSTQLAQQRTTAPNMTLPNPPTESPPSTPLQQPRPKPITNVDIPSHIPGSKQKKKSLKSRLFGGKKANSVPTIDPTISQQSLSVSDQAVPSHGSPTTAHPSPPPPAAPSPLPPPSSSLPEIPSPEPTGTPVSKTFFTSSVAGPPSQSQGLQMSLAAEGGPPSLEPDRRSPTANDKIVRAQSVAALPVTSSGESSGASALKRAATTIALGKKDRLADLVMALTKKPQAVVEVPEPVLAPSRPDDTRFRLFVQLVRGEHLPSGRWGGSQDPYVKLRIGSEEYTSTIKHSCKHPEWNETFEFVITEAERKTLLLEIDVFDHDDLSNDDSIGSTIVALVRFPVVSGENIGGNMANYYRSVTAAFKDVGKGRVVLQGAAFELARGQIVARDNATEGG